MNLLQRRRGMMGENGGNGFLYPLIPGTMTHQFRITTTETGHITMYNSSRQTGNKYANLRDVAQYYTSGTEEQMSRPLWFELRAGQVCVFESLNLTAAELRLYLANSTTVYKQITTSNNSLTFTVENDVEIGSVGIRTTVVLNAGTTTEFDISLTVDGRRYF